MSALVYQAICAVAGELATTGVPKNHRNEEGDYAYRSIDDVVAALSPLLARHKLCVLPRVLHREAVRSEPRGPEQLVVLRVAFDLVSAIDGSRHVVETFGEALDDSDKGSAKAMSAAYKSAMLQALCVPVGEEDSGVRPQRAGRHRIDPVAVAEPPEKWESWSAEVIHIAKSCESADAIDRLTRTRRPALAALQRSRPELYAAIGEAIAGRLAELRAVQRPVETTTTPKRPRRKSNGNASARAKAA